MGGWGIGDLVNRELVIGELVIWGIVLVSANEKFVPQTFNRRFRRSFLKKNCRKCDEKG